VVVGEEDGAATGAYDLETERSRPFRHRL
jgi:hypothetical protein